MELCHVVRDMDAAIEHWTTAIGAGPFGPMEKIHQAHAQWDGKTDPKRNFFALVVPSFVTA